MTGHTLLSLRAGGVATHPPDVPLDSDRRRADAADRSSPPARYSSAAGERPGLAVTPAGWAAGTRGHCRPGLPAEESPPGWEPTRSPDHAFSSSVSGALARRIIEIALEREMDQHLGYGKHSASGRNHLNSRNGPRAKTISTDLGPLRVACPRDRYGTFEPTVLRKRQVQVDGLGPLAVALLTPRTTPEQILSRFRASFGDGLPTSVIVETISAVGREVVQLPGRPLHRARYSVLSVGAMTFDPWNVPSAASQALGTVGLTPTGDREIVSLLRSRPGDHPELWTRHLRNLRLRGLSAVDLIVCDDRPEQILAVREVWPDAALRVAADDIRGSVPGGLPAAEDRRPRTQRTARAR